jgi:hypothetical protein
VQHFAYTGLPNAFPQVTAVDAVKFILSLLLLASLRAVAGFTVFAWVTAVASIADVPGVTKTVVGISAVSFEHAVAGCPDVTGFPAVDGVLAVASALADPGVPILAGGFTSWIVEKRTTLSDYRTMAIVMQFFRLLNYQNIEYRIDEFKKLLDYRISDQGLNLSDYRISDSEKTVGCSPLIFCD